MHGLSRILALRMAGRKLKTIPRIRVYGLNNVIQVVLIWDHEADLSELPGIQFMVRQVTSALGLKFVAQICAPENVTHLRRYLLWNFA